MVIKKLILRDFRNFSNIEIDPEPIFNIFWGNNGQGKTNILESIYLLGTLRSFRSSRNEDLIKWKKPEALIFSKVISRGINRNFQLKISLEGKHPLIDNKPVNRAENFFGFLRPVLFAPEEVSLVKGPPAGRRILLDRAIFQGDPGYLRIAQNYEKILRNRNRLLRDGRTFRELDPWTASLARSGSQLRLERFLYLKRVLPHFQRSYLSISGGSETAHIEYREGGDDQAALEEKLFQELTNRIETERRLATTLAGPHRDDPFFMVNGLPAKPFASQGQQRSLILAFKTAQVIDLEQSTGETPVLLLDDLTGELDRRRQEFFFRFLLERQGQVFISTTDPEPLIKEGFAKATRFHVREGTLAT